jgi:transcriptional regulator with XRE-family HTH domain
MAKEQPPDTRFATRLRAIRTELGLTLAELSDRAGMHLQSIAKLESGQREPSWATVQALARALGVDIREDTPTAGAPIQYLWGR